MDHVANLKAYAQGIEETLEKLPWDAIARTVEVLWKCCQQGGRIFTMGNGGHSNTAAHMINDLAKHTVTSDDKRAVVAEHLRFRTLCLNDSVSFLTGIGNDMGYDYVFSEQVANWVQQGDVVIGISGSGNSRNVLLAFEEARRRGATTICFSGFEGGKARDVADINIIVPCHKMVQVEDLHLMINHMIADELKRLVQSRQELTG
ncbi:MAG TPA: SIS domain-containing protein [Terriglobia bacterium]|nr:SIS domain-containing protein [Terriglobia bacterium]